MSRSNRVILLAIVVLAVLMYRWDQQKYDNKHSSLGRNEILAVEYEDLKKITDKLDQFELLISELDQQVTEIEKRRAEDMRQGVTPKKDEAYIEIKTKLEEVQKYYQEKLLSHQDSRNAFMERYNNNINEYNSLPHPLVIHRNDLPRRLERSYIFEEKPNKAL